MKETIDRALRALETLTDVYVEIPCTMFRATDATIVLPSTKRGFYLATIDFEWDIISFNDDSITIRVWNGEFMMWSEITIDLKNFKPRGDELFKIVTI